MNHYRTHNCSQLNLKNLNENVILSGWIQRIRDHGNLVFLDLRDNYGITQCVIDSSHDNFNTICDKFKECFAIRCQIIDEYKVTVQELYDLKLNIGGSEKKIKKYAKDDLIYDICNRKLLNLE